jgi:hypothetical protein
MDEKSFAKPAGITLEYINENKIVPFSTNK